MAGSYPDIPGPRIPYHENGTIVAFNGDNALDAPSAVTATQASYLNDENDNTTLGGPGTYTTHVFFFFPAAYDLVGYFIVGVRDQSGWGPHAVDYSHDTTNGVDGTWLSWDPNPPEVQNNMLGYRNAIVTPSTITSVVAIRITYGNLYERSLRTVHLYGKPSSGVLPDRLELWHPSVDQSLTLTPAYFDWGNVAQGTSQVKSFRVKNLSSTLTAGGINLSFEVLFDSGTAFKDAHQLSPDSATYSTSLSISDLGPGAISPVKYLRFAPTLTQPLSIWSGFVRAIATTWT